MSSNANGELIICCVKKKKKTFPQLCRVEKVIKSEKKKMNK